MALSILSALACITQAEKLKTKVEEFKKYCAFSNKREDVVAAWKQFEFQYQHLSDAIVAAKRNVLADYANKLESLDIESMYGG